MNPALANTLAVASDSFRVGERLDEASSPLNKLPQITLAFWILKICATTLGETAGDLLSMTLNVGYAVSSLMLFAVFASPSHANCVQSNSTRGFTGR